MDKKMYGCVSCAKCDDGCKKPCGPAAYARQQQQGGQCNCPEETDTTLSINYSNATLNYKAERHEDILTGAQVGSIVRVEDLRDTKCDYTTEAMCYELIYHKYGECGEGCRAIEDSWSTFSIDNDGALRPQIRFVRGANVFGCPEYLDVPANPAQYWFAGWRTETNQFGYYQATPVNQLPTNANGDYYVMSQYPSNKQPVIGVLPWQCMLENIFGNMGVNVEGVWQKSQGTTGFGADFDQISGNFNIHWDDWNDLQDTQHAGHGEITGKVNWDVSFDATTGSMKYVIHDIYFDMMTWTVDQGVTGATAPTLKLVGISIPSGTQTTLIPGITFGKTTVSQVINETIICDQTVIVGPGQTQGPFNFAYIYVDWIGDDEGYLGIKFSSNLSGWKQCD